MASTEEHATNLSKNGKKSVLETVLESLMLEKGKKLSLIHGPSGVGTTNLLLQFAYCQAMQNMSTLFISLNEKPEDIRDNALQFGWDLTNLEENNLFRILDVYSARFMQKESSEALAIRGQFDIPSLAKAIHQAFLELEFNNIVIDSLSSLSLSFPIDHQLYDLITRLLAYANSKSDISLIGWSKESESPLTLKPDPFLPLFHGVVNIDYDEENPKAKLRKIEISKVRGAAIEKPIYFFSFQENGPAIIE